MKRSMVVVSMMLLAGAAAAETVDASHQTCTEAFNTCRSYGGPEFYCEPIRVQCMKDGTFKTPFGTVYVNLQRK